MARITLKDGLKFELHGQEYQLIERGSPGEWKILNVVTRQHSNLSEDTIVNFLFKGELKFITATSQQHIAFPDLSEAEKNDAIWREKYVRKILERGVYKTTPQALEPIIQEVYYQLKVAEDIPQEIRDKSQPSHIAVYQWLRKYKQSEGNIHSLVSNISKKGNRSSRLDPAIHEIIKQVIDEVYLNSNGASIKDTYDRVIAVIVEENQRRGYLNLTELKIPAYMAIRNLIQKIPPQERDQARLGKKTSDLIHQPVYVGQGLNPTRPLEIVAIDHSLLPFYILDNDYRLPVGLPWLTTAIDIYSQTVVGYYLTFEPPSYLSVMYCLLHSIRAKEYIRLKYKSVKNDWKSFGLMETLKVDNGTDFRGKSLEDACRELKINLEFCPVRMPWYKASVERFFGSIKTQFSGTIPGRCLELLAKSDYDPKKQAVVTLHELQEIIHIFIVDIHNQDAHIELKSPRASVWNHAVQSYPISVPCSDDTLKVLLGDIDERTISRKGIEFNYLFYNSARLQTLRERYETDDFRRKDKIRGKEKAKFKYNRNDLSVIHVFDPQPREYLAVPANNQDYTRDLSLSQHRIIHRYASSECEKVDIVALALAKQRIQDIVGDAIKKTKAAKTSKQVIKFLGTGRGENVIISQEQSLKAIEQADSIDIITSTKSLLPSLNSGISDFSSALERDEEVEKLAVAVLPNDVTSIDNKTKNSKAQKKSEPKVREKSVASKPNSKTKPTASKKQTLKLELKQHVLSEIVESSSSENSTEEQQPNQEKQYRATIGLPQWKPPSR